MSNSSDNRTPGQSGPYKIGPFVLESEFPIPELPFAKTGESPDVRVRYGTVPVAIRHAGTREDLLEVSPREALLRIRGVAQIWIGDAREIVIQPEPGALEADLRAYLAAAAFGVLCHQSGMLPLHASSIQVGNGVAAFLGDSGAGKSTLAAFLARRGYPVVSDDICLLVPSAGHPPLVVPVAPWMKLWRNTVEQLGRSPDELDRVFSDDDKFRMGVVQGEERLPLKQIFVLGWNGDTLEESADLHDDLHEKLAEPGAPLQSETDTIRIDAIDTLHAIQSMLEFTHQAYLIKGMGRTRECFDLCGQVLSGARTYRLQRPHGFEHIERVLDALESHFAARAEAGSL